MAKTSSDTILLHSEDNVRMALRAFEAGDTVDGLTVSQAVSRGHKIATREIAQGDAIRKYNQVIGFASVPIAAGDHVHTQNCAYRADFERDPEPCAGAQPTDFVPASERAQFMGYKRPDGRVGTRNYIGILTTVNCSATVARMAAAHFTPERLAAFPNVDGVAAFTHGTGCGMAMDGEGFGMLQRTLAGYAAHPNFAGVLVIGLGCEVMQISLMMETYGLKEGERFQRMTIQETGGTRKTVEEAVRRIEAMLPAADACRREAVSAEHLSVALQCGGSDGYSGITANPALGNAADQLVRHGGTAILAETPEIFGAEHLLTRRAETPEIAEKLLERIRWWEDYTARNKGVMDNNPSPGNKAGGLTTILEKSLGAAAKGGTTNLTGVYEYSERVTTPGFVFMDSPGYDPASITGQVASGANLVCFTTGRGSVFGYKPAPSMKLATNSEMFARMSDDMDINCGVIVSDGVSVEEMGEQIFQEMLDVASGKRTKSEDLGFGDNEFIPWQVGAVM
ncbi:UxaA family hydrolase [Tropicimonas isoalkanivorans]|uniref:Altronate hydrolase n=1 Tax=Tropicimonas isoalkanivorans TaxID=441112 RepID=A0A1I1JDA5_9RHOB|nr:altronate dehydratase family protein [Tropicimonas isoalkanivorans]SFC46534.1 altronate hydrolase [Tropicimonas isoalkanivorans]